VQVTEFEVQLRHPGKFFPARPDGAACQWRAVSSGRLSTKQRPR